MKNGIIFCFLMISCSSPTARSTNDLIANIDQLFSRDSPLEKYFAQFDHEHARPSSAVPDKVYLKVQSDDCPQLILDLNESQVIVAASLSCELGSGMLLSNLKTFQVETWERRPYRGPMGSKKLSIKRYYLIGPNSKNILLVEDFQQKIRILSWSK